MFTSGLPIVYAPAPLIVGFAEPASSPDVIGIFDPRLSALTMLIFTVGENPTACAFIARFG